MCASCTWERKTAEVFESFSKSTRPYKLRVFRRCWRAETFSFFLFYSHSSRSFTLSEPPSFILLFTKRREKLEKHNQSKSSRRSKILEGCTATVGRNASLRDWLYKRWKLNFRDLIVNNSGNCGMKNRGTLPYLFKTLSNSLINCTLVTSFKWHHELLLNGISVLNNS